MPRVLVPNAALPRILALETSCDDTAAAVVEGGRLRSSVVAAQAEHAAFGGVVPEVASRAHQRHVVEVVDRALAEAGLAPSDVDAVAATYGPGLAGALLVGLSFAKGYALARGVPFVGVNHLEGHLYSVFLGDDGERTPPAFPFLALTVSGGHTNLVLVEDGFRHTVLGRTRDDAAGEAFDKVAKLLGLGYPGGPLVDRLAAEGHPSFMSFPRTRLPGFDFSFSGIKTAVRYALDPVVVKAGEPRPDRDALLNGHLADLCASFQAAVVDMLVEPLGRALDATGVRDVAVVGGVSANTGLRAAAERLCIARGAKLHVPPPRFCTDNAAMIGVTAYHRLRAFGPSPLTLSAAPALTLADTSAPAPLAPLP